MRILSVVTALVCTVTHFSKLRLHHIAAQSDHELFGRPMSGDSERASKYDVQTIRAAGHPPNFVSIIFAVHGAGAVWRMGSVPSSPSRRALWGK